MDKKQMKLVCGKCLKDWSYEKESDPYKPNYSQKEAKGNFFEHNLNYHNEMANFFISEE